MPVLRASALAQTIQLGSFWSGDYGYSIIRFRWLSGFEVVDHCNLCRAMNLMFPY